MVLGEKTGQSTTSSTLFLIVDNQSISLELNQDELKKLNSNKAIAKNVQINNGENVTITIKKAKNGQYMVTRGGTEIPSFQLTKKLSELEDGEIIKSENEHYNFVKIGNKIYCYYYYDKENKKLYELDENYHFKKINNLLNVENKKLLLKLAKFEFIIKERKKINNINIKDANFLAKLVLNSSPELAKQIYDSLDNKDQVLKEMKNMVLNELEKIKKSNREITKLPFILTNGLIVLAKSNALDKNILNEINNSKISNSIKKFLKDFKKNNEKQSKEINNLINQLYEHTIKNTNNYSFIAFAICEDYSFSQYFKNGKKIKEILPELKNMSPELKENFQKLLSSRYSYLPDPEEVRKVLFLAIIETKKKKKEKNVFISLLKEYYPNLKNLTNMSLEELKSLFIQIYLKLPKEKKKKLLSKLASLFKKYGFSDQEIKLILEDMEVQFQNLLSDENLEIFTKFIIFNFGPLDKFVFYSLATKHFISVASYTLSNPSFLNSMPKEEAMKYITDLLIMLLSVGNEEEDYAGVVVDTIERNKRKILELYIKESERNKKEMEKEKEREKNKKEEEKRMKENRNLSNLSNLSDLAYIIYGLHSFLLSNAYKSSYFFRLALESGDIDPNKDPFRTYNRKSIVCSEAAGKSLGLLKFFDKYYDTNIPLNMYDVPVRNLGLSQVSNLAGLHNVKGNKLDEKGKENVQNYMGFSLFVFKRLYYLDNYEKKLDWFNNHMNSDNVSQFLSSIVGLDIYLKQMEEINNKLSPEDKKLLGNSRKETKTLLDLFSISSDEPSDDDDKNKKHTYVIKVDIKTIAKRLNNPVFRAKLKNSISLLKGYIKNLEESLLGRLAIYSTNLKISNIFSHISAK